MIDIRSKYYYSKVLDKKTVINKLMNMKERNDLDEVLDVLNLLQKGFTIYYLFDGDRDEYIVKKRIEANEKRKN